MAARRRCRLRAAGRLLAGLLGALACCSPAGFVPASPRLPARAGLPLARRRAGGGGGEGDKPKDVLPNSEFMMGSGFDQVELEDVAALLSQGGSDRLWDAASFGAEYDTEDLKEIPRYRRWLTIRQVEAVLGRLRPGTSPTTASALVMTISGGSGFLQKNKVQEAFDSWSGGGAFSSGAFGATMMQSRAAVAFSFWFLNVFAPFCTYFFFLRPPLKSFTGLDLLPGLPEWWNRG